MTIEDFSVNEAPTWCPGCGNFSLLSAIKGALVDLDVPREKALLVSGIGCGSKLPHFVKTFGFEGLHGRSIAVATGAKLANQELTVIAVAGDGDTYGIGGNHFIHSMRRNIDMTLIVQNNSVYGLTKGQYSPTSPRGFKSPSSPNGAIEEPVNSIATAITMGVTYAARGYAPNPEHLRKLIAGGIRHKGFSLIDVLIPCKTFNKVNTAEWYNERIYNLEESGYKPGSREDAWKKSREAERVPIGLFYQEERKTYGDLYPPSQNPPVTADISNIDISPILKGLK